jgi:hypothetical protein
LLVTGQDLLHLTKERARHKIVLHGFVARGDGYLLQMKKKIGA